MAKAESSSARPSIGIIADDLTGAAELAGVAWRYGFSAEIHTDCKGPPCAEVVALDTDSRHCNALEATRRVQAAALHMKSWGVKWIYKKVDSVLRGNIVIEVEAILATLKQDRALLVPANPQLGRTIRDGTCFVAGTPLHQTDFRNDPQHPRLVSQVLDLLGGYGSSPISNRRLQDEMPDNGITIGNASSTRDLQLWAKKLDPTTLAVGGAEFFAAILGTRGRFSEPQRLMWSPGAEGRSLFVCGSMSASAMEFLKDCRRRGLPVVALPAVLLQAEVAPHEVVQTWANEINAAFQQDARVVAAIEMPYAEGKADTLTAHLVAAVKAVVAKVSLSHINAEGGATAAALIRALGWSRLAVVGELSPGIVTTRAEANTCVALTIKPGSYRWPDTLCS
jgi:D-threonate/D-erythronate kinase